MSEKVGRLVNKPLLHAEKIQLVYYSIGNEYKPHYDGWDHNGSQKTYTSFRRGGQRLTTVIVYLNEVEEGGSTQFSKLNTFKKLILKRFFWYLKYYKF